MLIFFFFFVHETWKKTLENWILWQNCRNFWYSQNRFGLLKQLKTFVAFLLFPTCTYLLSIYLWFGSHWIGIRRLELEKKMYIMNHRDLWPFVPYQRPLSDSVVCLRPAWISDLKKTNKLYERLFVCLNNPNSYSKQPKFWVVFWSQLT